MMQKWLVCQKRGGRRPVLPCFNCISALVCQDTQESIALGCVLNPQCTPTGPSHSLHARAVAALSACSHSICNDTKSFFFLNVEHDSNRRTPHNTRALSPTCIYLVLSAWCPARNPGKCLALGSLRAPQWLFPRPPGCSDQWKRSHYFLAAVQKEKDSRSRRAWIVTSGEGLCCPLGLTRPPLKQLILILSLCHRNLWKQSECEVKILPPNWKLENNGKSLGFHTKGVL